MSQRFLHVTLALAACSGCSVGLVWNVEYEYEPAAVYETTAGRVDLETTTEGRTADLIVGDDAAAFRLDVQPSCVVLDIRNTGSEPLTLGLDRARYVSFDGEELPLEFSLTSADGAPRAFVEPGAAVSLMADLQHRAASRASRKETRARARADIGRAFALLLPVEDAGEHRLYRFTFTVRDVHLQRGLGPNYEPT